MSEPTRAKLGQVYAAALAHGAKAESLTVLALRDSVRDATLAGNPAGHLADVLYTFSRATTEYECAAAVLDPFLGLADSEVSAFVDETKQVFGLYSAWIEDFVRELKRKVGGDPRPLVEEAQVIADLRRRRDALSDLIRLNSAGLTFLLVDHSVERSTRLLLTAAQRDSLVTRLRPISTSSAQDVAAVAAILLEWIGKGWGTRP